MIIEWAYSVIIHGNNTICLQEREVTLVPEKKKSLNYYYFSPFIFTIYDELKDLRENKHI